MYAVNAGENLMSEKVVKSIEELAEFFIPDPRSHHEGETDWSVDLNTSIWVSPNIKWEQERAYLKELVRLIIYRNLSNLEKELELKHTCGEWLRQQILKRRFSLTEKSNWRKINRDD